MDILDVVSGVRIAEDLLFGVWIKGSNSRRKEKERAIHAKGETHGNG